MSGRLDEFYWSRTVFVQLRPALERLEERAAATTFLNYAVTYADGTQFTQDIITLGMTQQEATAFGGYMTLWVNGLNTLVTNCNTWLSEAGAGAWANPSGVCSAADDVDVNVWDFTNGLWDELYHLNQNFGRSSTVQATNGVIAPNIAPGYKDSSVIDNTTARNRVFNLMQDIKDNTNSYLSGVNECKNAGLLDGLVKTYGLRTRMANWQQQISNAAQEIKNIKAAFPGAFNP